MKLSLAILLLAVAALNSSCRMVGTDKMARTPHAEATLPHRISLVNWNAHKGADEQLVDDLHQLLEERSPDILFLQEAKADLLLSGMAVGHFARSWRYPWPGGDTVGVLNASRVQPVEVCPLPTQHREFGLTAPKVSLATFYPLPDGQSLMAVNVHCLNFERWTTDKFEAQLAGLLSRMDEHTGPIILAGDFNTWSDARYQQVQAMVEQLDLHEVDSFPESPRTGDQGSLLMNTLLGINKDLALDRIFYRGLICECAEVLDYASSDHLALAVSFLLPTVTAEAEHPPSS